MFYFMTPNHKKHYGGTVMLSDGDTTVQNDSNSHTKVFTRYSLKYLCSPRKYHGTWLESHGSTNGITSKNIETPKYRLVREHP